MMARHLTDAHKKKLAAAQEEIWRKKKESESAEIERMTIEAARDEEPVVLGSSWERESDLQAILLMALWKRGLVARSEVSIRYGSGRRVDVGLFVCGVLQMSFEIKPFYVHDGSAAEGQREDYESGTGKRCILVYGLLGIRTLLRFYDANGRFPSETTTIGTMIDKTQTCVLCGYMTGNEVILGSKPRPRLICRKCMYSRRAMTMRKKAHERRLKQKFENDMIVDEIYRDYEAKKAGR
jgi:hypothetical protein